MASREFCPLERCAVDSAAVEPVTATRNCCGKAAGGAKSNTQKTSERLYERSPAGPPCAVHSQTLATNVLSRFGGYILGGCRELRAYGRSVPHMQRYGHLSGGWIRGFAPGAAGFVYRSRQRGLPSVSDAKRQAHIAEIILSRGRRSKPKRVCAMLVSVAVLRTGPRGTPSVCVCVLVFSR